MAGDDDERKIESWFCFLWNSEFSIADIGQIKAPVYGFYGEKDNDVTSTVDDTTAKMKEAGKNYESKIYTDAGHGFMRSGEAPDPKEPDQKARTEAWSTLMGALKKL